MKAVHSLMFMGLAQALHQFSSNGVDYSIVMTQNGVEVPVTLGPALQMNSTGPVATFASRHRRNNVESTGNWCGMSNTEPPSGTWKSVWGGWVVPQVSLRSDQTNADEPSIAQWVGIDGDGCNSGLIQGGTVSQVSTRRVESGEMP